MNRRSRFFQKSCATKVAPFHFQLCHDVTNGTVIHLLGLTGIAGFPFVFKVIQ
jgi:hypothetical protein